MLIKDIMTRKVVTIPSNTSIGDVKKLMKENKFRRVPVVDKDRLVGIVTEDRLDRVSPSAGAPLLWQVGYLISHTTVKDVMQKEVVTISPDATVEQGAVLAQSRKVGALVVTRNDKVIGIVTTNDFFYNVLNPSLGIGVTGPRIKVSGGGSGTVAEKVLSALNALGVEVKVIMTARTPRARGTDLILQLGGKSAKEAIAALQKLGFEVSERAR